MQPLFPFQGDVMFNSIAELSEWLEANQKLVLTSTPKKLRSWNILLQSLTSGDFNPAHCRPEFLKRSYLNKRRKLSSAVSHGIGGVSRAEAQFINLLAKQFKIPTDEVIAIGYDKIRYKYPLCVGDIYQYRLEITECKFKEDRYDLVCNIFCEILEPTGKRLVSKAEWLPAIAWHEADEEAIRLLQPKSYARNVFEIFIKNPFDYLMLRLTFSTFAVLCAIALVAAVLAAMGKFELFDDNVLSSPIFATALL